MRKVWIAAALTVALAAALAAAGCHKAPPRDDAVIMADAKANTDFMARTAKEPGVVTLPSGLMYKIVSDPNPNAPRPSISDTVKIHYEGKLVNGKVFDSSYERGAPAVYPLANLIKAWQIGIPLMHKGDTYMLYVPAALGYGDAGAGDEIPPGSVLIFKVQLLDIEGK